jgi:pyrrolidone-carboxylate peptidase
MSHHAVFPAELRRIFPFWLTNAALFQSVFSCQNCDRYIPGQFPLAGFSCVSSATFELTRPIVRLLLTAFGPFGTMTENTSSTVAEQEADRLSSMSLHSEFRGLATSTSSVQTFSSTIHSQTDLFVIHIGVDLKSSLMKLELAGHNIAHFRLPDADGITLLDARISDSFPFNHPFPKSFNLPALLARFVLSDGAGTYFCNYTYFTGRTHVGTDIRGCLFVHIPPFSEIDCETAVARIALVRGDCEARHRRPF